jgi:shikimate dehydrogenase
LFDDGEIIGSNTDGAGFIAALDEASENWRGKPATVLGAGGATRAIIVALAEAGAPHITLANRTRARAEPLAALLDDSPTQCTIVDWARRHEGLADCGLLVNATSLGMGGHPPLELSLDGLASGAMVSDIVYTPLHTPLLQMARAGGYIAVDGLGMLINQAALSFETWFGVKPTVDAALRARLMADLGET